jgi:predicted acyltransferase
VAAARPANAVWSFLCFSQSHVAWIGGSLHDLIQPGFSFLVGVALPFSLAARRAKGQDPGQMRAHAFKRAFILVVLGIFLRSLARPQTYFTFEDTLTQIGLGYGFLYLLGLRPRRDQWIAFALILVVFWAAFAFYPLPPADFDWESVGVENDWPHLMSGFQGHWNKNENFSAAFDRWFLNLFPREEPFVYNTGGYQTLSFIPTLATMILGLLAGGILIGEKSARERLRWLVVAGIIGIASGWLLGAVGICPVVKRIWTPSFTLWSGGLCFLFLAGFHFVVDVRGRQRWAFPLVVLGMNSIAAYCADWLWPEFISEALVRHLGDGPFLIFGAAYEPLLLGATMLLALWLILYWMYRRRIFLRI